MTTERLRVSIDKREFWYISNILSLFRILLLPLIIFGLTKKTAFHRMFTLSVMVVSMITDSLDGYLARKLNEVSALGKILDPVGDKLSIGVVAIAVTVLRDFPWWAMGFIIFRDTGILIGGSLMIGRWTVITSSNIWGKATTIFQSLSVISYAFDVQLPVINRSHVLTVAMVFTAVSSISYGMEFYHLAKDQREGKLDNDENGIF